MATRCFLLACTVVVFASTLLGQDPPTLKPNPTQPGKQLTPPLAREIQYNSTLRQWLMTTREIYRGWLSNLEVFPSPKSTSQ